MNVGETISITRQWIEEYGCRVPGYRAAHLMGSLSSLPHDTTFAAYRDVDIALVLDEGAKSDQDNLEVTYRGLIIECGFYSADQYGSADALLSNPGLAPHLAVDSVLHDPHGLLRAVQPAVAREYRRRRWVLARCEVEKRDALRRLEQLHCAETFDDYLGALYPLVVESLCGLLAVAQLHVPTHRRCLALARVLLQQASRPELHEALLDLLGHARLTRKEVDDWLEPAGEIFDRAVAVKRSPSPYGFKLHAHIRPYFVEGARELIEEGLHREAMWWLVFCYYACNAAIQNDGDADEKAYYQARYHTICGPLATQTTAERQARTLCARRLADKLFVLADELVAHHPLVVQ